MTAVHASQLVNGYLGRLELELTGVPAAKRREILDEIRGHIADERHALVDESDADLMNLLDRLGEPAEIAAEARCGERPVNARIPSRLGTLEALALALSIIAWPIGIALMWTSSAWTRRQKVIGTVVPPGGYPGVFLIVASFHSLADAAEPFPSWLRVTLAAVLFTISLVLLVAPIGTVAFLTTRLRGRPAFA
jgi:HAAS domain-containing protein